MKYIISKKWFLYGVYLFLSLIGIWLLTRYWIPEGYVIAGHDSGLAIESSEFFKTRFYAWDERLNFGSDNSPHFGSIIMHFIDYIISVVAQVPYAGSQIAMFFWISAIYLVSFIFSYSLREKFGDYFTMLFPVFLTFNFFILQSIFILERAKYELIISTLVYLTLSLKIFDKEKINVLKYSIIFSLVITLFNGGGWFGLPLYGSLFVIACSSILFSIAYGIKTKNYSFFKNLLKFNLFNLVFYFLLNAYSILPYLTTLINSDFAKVVSVETINAGYEWLNYISRGSSFLNLFRMQGIPDWYLTGYGANPEHSYAGLYLTNYKLVFVSFLIPVIAFMGLSDIQKNIKNKYIITFFLLILLISMFFASGTNSPLGFVYEFLYTKIPGFNIFRSPYYKFTPSYLIAFSFLLSYSLSLLFWKFKDRRYLKAILFLIILFGWFWYHQIIFDRNKIFTWQPNKTTLIRIPNYVDEFTAWSKDNKLEGRILVLPAYNETWRDDSYDWGYWSLSPLQSLLSKNFNFLSNDLNINAGENLWVDEIYKLVSINDINNFLEIANRLNINYIFVKSDYSNEQDKISINGFIENDYFNLIKSFDQWKLYSINTSEKSSLIKVVDNIVSIPSAQQFFQAQIYDEQYTHVNWINSEDDKDFSDVLSKKIYSVACESCQVENLSIHTQTPVVRILPSSPLYKIKQIGNEKIIKNTTDQQSLLGVYMGLTMLKFSEIKSMHELKIEKETISKSLKDLNIYLKSMISIVQNNDIYSTNFYLASKSYEIINPIQRYFRDYYFDRSYIKDDVLDTLWFSVTFRKLFDPIANQGNKWVFQKLYRLDSIPKSDYQLLIDSQTLPSDIDGNVKLPDKLSINDGSNEYKIVNIDTRFILTDTQKIEGNTLTLHFSNLPNLYNQKDNKVLDFPEGEKGCVIGEIKNFNKNRMYKFQISSSKDIDTSKLYIKEKKDKLIRGFLESDVEIDVTTNINSKYFEYVYFPDTNAINPQVYLCKHNKSLAESISIVVHEVYSPLIYLVANNDTFLKHTSDLDYKKIDSTKYKITIDSIDGSKILLFNSRFSNLWKLTDTKANKEIKNHYLINGYANSWILNKGDGLEFDLEYLPQRDFNRGMVISLLSLFMLLSSYIYIKK